MKKVNNNFKLMLIQEYIHLINIVNYLNSIKNNHSVINDISVEYENLVKVYEKIFFRLNMLDLSLALLKKEFSYFDTSNSVRPIDLRSVVDILQKQLSTCKTLLKEKIDALSFNEFERFYLIST